MNYKKIKIKFSDTDKFVIFIIAIVFFTLLRCVLTSQSSIYIGDSVYDDWLVIQRAENLANGNWLGEYNHLSLVKGIGFELFLVFFNLFKISFVNAQTIMYTLACLYFIYSIRNIVKNKFSLVIIYVLMLFNPVSLSKETFQRVYRYSIISFQIIFIISSYYILYENITTKNERLWPHILIATVFFTWFRLTIESYVWIMPFIIVVTGILIFNIIKNKKHIIINILKVSMPILIMFLIISLIKLMNLKCYGTYTYNEIFESNFSNALKAIYSVDVHDNIELVSVSQSKIKKLYEISPSLNSIKSIFDDKLATWKNYDQIIDNDEIEDGWFYWAFRESVMSSEHNTSQKSDEFYKNVANEINSAIKDGKVDSKTVMPNPLMSPFRKEYISKWFKAMCESFTYVISFDGTEAVIIENNPSFNGFDVLNKCSNNENILATNIISKIIYVYKTINIFLVIISLGIYIYVCKEFLLKHNKKYKNVWLISTACILSSIILIAGVSYTHISAFNSIKYLYFSGAYPLMMIFICLNIFFVLEQRKSTYIGVANEKN